MVRGTKPADHVRREASVRRPLRRVPSGAPRGSHVFARADGAMFVALSALHGAALLAWPVAPVIALGIWWNSNTIAHNWIHRPFFRSCLLDLTFSAYQSLLLGIPQTIYRERHLAHHAGATWHRRPSARLLIETTIVLALWGTLASLGPEFFLFIYLPGYLLGLALCALQGHYEHAGGTTSHYGRLYNVVCFNDGYHVEHHAAPGVRWSELSGRPQAGARSSRWPPLLRWLEGGGRELSRVGARGVSIVGVSRVRMAAAPELTVIPAPGARHALPGGGLSVAGLRWAGLETLERIVLRFPVLQSLIVASHRRAFRRMLHAVGPVRRAVIVGGGLFPRTAIVLHELAPAAELVVVDASARNLARASSCLARRDVDLQRTVTFRHERFTLDSTGTDADLLVVPLAYQGDRAAIYARPPAPVVLVHDWIWNVRGEGCVISTLLLKRLNLARRRLGPSST